MRPEAQIAMQALAAAQRIADARTGAGRVASKGGIDLVTDTDLACEDAIRTELLRGCPDYPVIGEERGGAPLAGRPYWLVDPICGTRTFASDIPLYCTNIALVEDGQVVLAAIGFGRTGEAIYAERGCGSRMKSANGDEPVTVGASSNSIWIDGSTEHAANVLRNAVLLKRWYVMRFPSTLASAYLACGRIAAVLRFSSRSQEPETGSVHFAAGCFIAQEAGALVTDLTTGEPWKLSTSGFLMAATPELHADLLHLIQEAQSTS